MLGERAAWDTNSYLLVRVAHLLAGANWQRGGGKGPKPKPIKIPDVPRRDRKAAGRDVARRLKNLGLIPGKGHGRDRPLSPREQAIADQLRRAQQQQRDDQGTS